MRDPKILASYNKFAHARKRQDVQVALVDGTASLVLSPRHEVHSATIKTVVVLRRPVFVSLTVGISRLPYIITMGRHTE